MEIIVAEVFGGEEQSLLAGSSRQVGGGELSRQVGRRRLGTKAVQPEVPGVRGDPKAINRERPIPIDRNSRERPIPIDRNSQERPVLWKPVLWKPVPEK